jgi:hypothetical protein
VGDVEPIKVDAPSFEERGRERVGFLFHAVSKYLAVQQFSFDKGADSYQ